VTGKAKEVDIYDRPEPKKKGADADKQRAMLSSNLEQSIIPEGTSKLQSSDDMQRATLRSLRRSTRLSMYTAIAPSIAARISATTLRANLYTWWPLLA
jgi:hypothetical protein